MQRRHRDVISADCGNVAIAGDFCLGATELQPEIWETTTVATLIEPCIVAQLALCSDACAFDFIRCAIREIQIEQDAFWPTSFNQLLDKPGA